jgi:hypothetical protein
MGFKNCNSEKKCPLHNHWDEIITKAYLMLSAGTIDEYKDKTICQPF